METVSDLTKVVTNAKSIPEATAAFQEWTTKQIELITSHTRKVIEETQDFTQACANYLSTASAQRRRRPPPGPIPAATLGSPHASHSLSAMPRCRR
jgi:hypothetical protein